MSGDFAKSGSLFQDFLKAVNNRDRNFTQGKVKARMQQIEQSIDRYLAAMDSVGWDAPPRCLSQRRRRTYRVCASFKLLACRSSLVYGCCGLSNIDRAGPCSTTLPSLITIMSCARAWTTARSWLINR